jgi:hypothetical protein
MHQPVQPKCLRWAIHLYPNTPPHVQAPPGRIRGILEWTVIILINAPAKIRTRDLWLWYHIELHAPTSSTQKLNMIGKGGQFTYTPTIIIGFYCCIHAGALFSIAWIRIYIWIHLVRVFFKNVKNFLVLPPFFYSVLRGLLAGVWWSTPDFPALCGTPQSRSPANPSAQLFVAAS